MCSTTTASTTVQKTIATPKNLMCQLLCLSIFALMTASPALSAQSDYDGRWAIVVTTEQGQCLLGGFRVKVRILRGKAYIIGHSISGAKTAISSRGQVSIKYVKGSDLITISGMLNERTGTGSWQYPTNHCAGIWRATKR